MEHTLKYYHTDHKGKWFCVPENQIPAEAKYESVLYVRYRAEDVEASGDDQEYWGPFYIDIDVNDDEKEVAIATALADMREILLYLNQQFNMNDKDYKVYASGGKGFHLEVNPYLFMDAKFKMALPLRYRSMAARIKQDVGEHLNIDMGVYSQGKGRQWRRANVKRENGNFKVQMNSSQFSKATGASVIEMTKVPGTVIVPFDKRKPNELFKSWFDSTKKVVELAKVSQPVPDTVILETEVPECVHKLATNTNVKGNVNSNLLTMQAISYGVAKTWDVQQIISYNRKFINEYRSSQYKTPAAFEDHFRGLYDYAKESPDKFKFGCKMMLSCVDSVDCNTCAIKVGEDVEESSGSIVVKEGGYWIIPDDADAPPRQLTNFTIKWFSETIKEDIFSLEPPVLDMEFSAQDTSDSRRMPVSAELFASKSSFTKRLSMGLAYFGSDRELQMLKLAVLHMNNPKKITEVEYTGLHWMKDEWHFVTKEGSMSLNGTIDMVKTTATAAGASKTRLNFEADAVPRADEIIRTFDAMTKVNAPHVIMPLVSWFFSAFFSPHCMNKNEPAPSLFVTGMHGSGKTQTMLQLHRLFAPDRAAFPSISSTTAFSMNKFCSSTNLMPLVFDEFKPTANSGRRGEEGQVSQAIRASYNKGYESRGTKNRTVEETPFLAPLAIIGEQQINEGAVQDRIILVHMDKSSHDQGNYDALEKLKMMNLEAIGAQFLEFAMSIRPQEFVDSVLRYDKQLMEEFGTIFENRPRRNMANLLTTVDFIEQYILLYTGDEALVDQINSKMQAYKDSFKEEASQVYNEIRTMDDIAQIIIQLNDMADLMDSSLGEFALMSNRHYVVKGDIVYLDLIACYKSLNAYIRKYHINMYLTDRTSFIAQLNQKTYATVKATKSDVITSGRPRLLIGLSKTRAEEYNIVMDNFKGVSHD